MLALIVCNSACQWKGALSRDLAKFPPRLAAHMLCKCCAALRCSRRSAYARSVFSNSIVISQLHRDGPDGCANSAKPVSISATPALRCPTTQGLRNPQFISFACQPKAWHPKMKSR
jgi:hypothetical protein